MKSITRPSGFGAGFARAGGGGLLGKMLGGAAAYRPGGAGGILSGLVQSASGLALAPARILSSFARLIPGVGSIISGVVGGAANILQGLVGIAANVVGGIINALGRLVSAAARIFERVVRAAGRILGRIVKVAAGVGLAAGAVLGWQMLKGIRENMRLADWRQVLAKVYGDGAKAAERFARDLSLQTPFTPMQALEAVAGLGAAGVDYKKYMGIAADWAAGAKRDLGEIIMIFQRIKAGQFGEALEGARRGLISAADLRGVGIKFDKQGRALATPMELMAGLAKVVEKRFDGMAEAASKVGSGPLSTLTGQIQDMRMELSEPWYLRFNQALIDMGTWLRKLAGEESWARLVEMSEAVADAIDTKLRGAIEWLTTRDWSKTWSGLLDAPRRLVDEVLPDVIGLLVKKTDDGLKAGPLTKAVVAGVQYLISKVLGVLEGLWAAIRTRATETIAGVFDSMAGGMQQKAIDILEKPKREAVAAARKRAQEPMVAAYVGANRLFGKSYEDLQKERWARVRELENKPASEFTPLPQDLVKVAAYQTTSQGLFDVGNAIRGVGQSSDESKERIAALGASAERAAASLDQALGATGAQTERIGGGLADIARGLFPALPEGQLERRDQEAAARAGEEDPAIKRLRAVQKRQGDVRKLLEGSGYKEEAERVAQQMEERDEQIITMLEGLADGQAALAEQAAETRRRVKRLGSSRR